MLFDPAENISVISPLFLNHLNFADGSMKVTAETPDPLSAV